MTQSTQVITLGGGLGVLPARDAAAYARAYTQRLGWPVAPGHRHRPRGGCTCSFQRRCTQPGAHPVGSWAVGARSDRVAEEFHEPGVSVIAPTQGFDAVVLPRGVGMAAMVTLDQRQPVPCLTTDETAVLLVLPGTGSTLEMCAASVRVRTGPEQWAALPPSHGCRWDTPPWDEATGAPVPLVHGHAIKPAVAEAVRTSAEVTQ